MNGIILGLDESHPMSVKYSELWDRLVPAQGEAATESGEAIRAVGRLLYEYCNNGNLNAAERGYEMEEVGCYCGEDEDCDECGGSGYYEEEVETGPEMTEFYDEFIETAEMYAKKHGVNLSKHADALRELICDPTLHYHYRYDEAEAKVYNEFCEPIVELAWKENN